MSDLHCFSLKDKVIVQFGSTGLLGRALIGSLGAAGATLVAASRNRAAIKLATSSATNTGGKVFIEEVDITSENSLHALCDRVLRVHRRVDGIVFNAVSRPMRTMHDDLSAWTESLKTNATGLLATVRIFGDAMAACGSGSIVNIASIQGMVGPNYWLYEGTDMTAPPDYFFHKGGMLNLTRYLAAHYGPRNVRVNAVTPGGLYNPEKPQAADFCNRYGKMTMLGRMGEAREVAGAVTFLLSDASSYVTGINLPVDGGYTAK